MIDYMIEIRVVGLGGAVTRERIAGQMYECIKGVRAKKNILYYHVEKAIGNDVELK